MTPWDWLNYAIVAAGITGWSYLMLGVREWRDRNADATNGPRPKWGRIQHLKTDAIARISPGTLWATWAVGAVAIWWMGLNWPAGKYALIIPLTVHGLRNLRPAESDDIARLRETLAQVIGVDDRGRPPKVTVDQADPDGQPLRITIAGVAGFKDWEKPQQDKVEHVIESRMPGDWENVDWLPDGASVWERLPDLPDRVDYDHHYPLPWYQIPNGDDGVDGIAVIDLSRYPHCFIGGTTRKGKTTVLRRCALHLLSHADPNGGQLAGLAVFDVKAGLSYLRGYRGVWMIATRTPENLTTGMAKLRAEMVARYDQLEDEGTYRKPIVALIDELAAAISRCNTVKERGDGKLAPFTRDLIEVAQLGGQVGIHLIVATQRPAAESIPIEVKEQCEGRVAVGPMSKEIAQMMFETGWQRAVNTADVRGRDVLGSMSGEDNRWTQGLWTADPTDEHHDLPDRRLAESLLPARDVDPASQIVGVVATDQLQNTPPTSDLGKRDPETISVTAAVSAPAAVSEPVAETPEERRLRLKRAGDERYRVKVRREILQNPNDRRHGTPVARNTAGCRCPKCRPELHEEAS